MNIVVPIVALLLLFGLAGPVLAAIYLATRLNRRTGH